MSLAQQAIDFIAKKGCARSQEIADEMGKDTSWVSAVLAHHVATGRLVTCKVTNGSKHQQNEYRISASGRPQTFVIASAKAEASAARGPVAPAMPVFTAATPSKPSAKTEAPRKVNDAQVHKPAADTMDRKSVYAVALIDLRAKRDYHAGEVMRIDTAIAAVEALG